MGPLIVLLIFFVFSCCTNCYGVIVSDIMTALNISTTTAGMLLTLYQVGAAVALGLSPFLIRRLNAAGLLRFGLITQILACTLIFFFPDKSMATVVFVILGLGGFYLDSGGNSYLSDNFPARKAKLVPMLHFTYSLGALLCGYLILPFKSPEKWNYVYGLVGVLLTALLLISLFGKKPRAEAVAAEKALKPEKLSVLLKDRGLVLYCLVMTCYAASQQICSSWFPLYVEQFLHAKPVLVATASMSFWIGIAVCRLLGPFLLSRNLKPIQFTMFGMLLSFISQILAMVSPNLVFSFSMIAICGFASGACIPFFIVEVTNWYPGSGKILSVINIISLTAGRMLFPYLVTYFSNFIGFKVSLMSSSVLLLAGAILSLVSYRDHYHSKSKARLA